VILRPPLQPLGDGAIVVRRSCERDVEALVRFGDDPDVAETVWLPIPTPCSHEAALERLAEFELGWEQETRHGPALIIAEAGQDEMIGVLLLRACARRARSSSATASRRPTAIAASPPLRLRC
jgi:RimJ/RimL family protein N-acetyltransferase